MNFSYPPNTLLWKGPAREGQGLEIGLAGLLLFGDGNGLGFTAEYADREIQVLLPIHVPNVHTTALWLLLRVMDGSYGRRICLLVRYNNSPVLMARKYNLLHQHASFRESKQSKYKVILIFGICGEWD